MQKMRDAGLMGEFNLRLRMRYTSVGVCPHARLHVTRVCVSTLEKYGLL